MKIFILCLTLTFLAAGSPFAQDQAEDPPPEDTQEEAPAEGEAAPTGGGGGAPGDLMFGAGILYTLSIGGTSETNAAKDPAFFPRGTISYEFSSFELEGELLLQTFQVESTGGLSSSGIAASTLDFSGQSYSIIAKFGEDIEYYGGYGINDYTISQSLSSSISTDASNAGVTFSQKLTAQSGTQLIFGAEWSLGETLHLSGDYRMVTVPADLVTSITTTSTSTSTQTPKTLSLDFSILSVGVTYTF
ncbi:MAG: hypothetical protein HQM13_11675 [SAR324 cluster bacterium]|nr:hypothetical protein [SAR324 cluster bacterium]